MNYEDRIKKIAELLQGAHIGFLTTKAQHNTLTSRPMGLQALDFDGNLWFFTYFHSNKAEQIRKDPEVTVAVQNKNDWLSLSGRAEMSQDRKKMKELWNPFLKAWFKKGLDEPGISLIKVSIHTVAYWDSDNKLVNLLKITTGALTGSQPDLGNSGKIKL